MPFLDHELVELAAALPAGAQDRPRRQGRAEGGRAPGDPGRGDRPAEGLLPGARAQPPRGPVPRPGARRAARAAPPRSAACSGPRPSTRCWPTRTADSPRCAATSCGSSACSSCGCRSTAVDRAVPHEPRPDRRRPEAITLGLHDASPPHLVDAMADDVVLDCGWGRLVFGQTFADPASWPTVLRGEAPGRRDICIYAREPARPGRPGARTSCSSTPATPTGCDSADGDGRRRPPPIRASRCGRCATVRGRRRDQPDLRALRHGARAHVDVIWDNQPHADAVELPGRRARRRRRGGRHRHRRRPRAAVRRPRGRLEPVVPGGRPDAAPARRRRGADPRAGRAIYRDRGRAYMDLSVLHDNDAAIALYEKLGFQPRPGARRQAQERDQRAAVRAGRRRPSTTSTRTPGSSPTRRCGAASGSRCSTPRPASCG